MNCVCMTPSKFNSTFTDYPLQFRSSRMKKNGGFFIGKINDREIMSKIPDKYAIVLNYANKT